jgi:hypothetical protein
LKAIQLKEIFSYETDVPDSGAGNTNSGAWNTWGMDHRCAEFRFDAERRISKSTDFREN